MVVLEGALCASDTTSLSPSSLIFRSSEKTQIPQSSGYPLAVRHFPLSNSTFQYCLLLHINLPVSLQGVENLVHAFILSSEHLLDLKMHQGLRNFSALLPNIRIASACAS